MSDTEADKGKPKPGYDWPKPQAGYERPDYSSIFDHKSEAGEETTQSSLPTGAESGSKSESFYLYGDLPGTKASTGPHEDITKKVDEGTAKPRIEYIDRSGSVERRKAEELIDVKSSLSTIELTFIALVIASVVLKISVGELAAQMKAGSGKGVFFDVSVSVGLISIALASIQIPRHFTDALIHANRDSLRILQIVGATPRLVSRILERVVSKSLFRAAWKGFGLSAVLYVVIAEVAQIWVPVTRTFFLREVAEVAIAAAVFMLITIVLIRWKVLSFYKNLHR